MNSVLITGSNRGIGLGLCKEFAKNKWKVYATSRKNYELTELNKLADNYNLSIHHMDINDLKSIKKLSKEIVKPLDILINNAGIQGSYPQKFDNIKYDEWFSVFNTNVMGVMRVSNAFLSQLLNSRKKIIINISSKTASISNKINSDSLNSKGDLYLYRSTKSALNMLTKSLAIDLRDLNVTVISLSPGWVKTNLGGAKADISVSESAKKCYSVINSLSIKDTGKFISNNREEILW